MYKKRPPFKRTQVRKPRTRYSLEIMMHDFGLVYGYSKRKNLFHDETLVRLRFRPRKYRGGMGWDVDRQQFHCYAVSKREQKHRMMRFGWEYHAYRYFGVLESLRNLRRMR